MSRESEAWEEGPCDPDEGYGYEEAWKEWVHRDDLKPWQSWLLFGVLWVVCAMFLGLFILGVIQDARMSPEEREQWARVEAAYRETGCTCEDGLGGGVIGGGAPRDMGGGGCTCGQEDW